MNIDVKKLSFPDFEAMRVEEIRNYIENHHYYKLFLAELNEEFPCRMSNEDVANYFMCKLIVDKYFIDHPACMKPSNDPFQNIRSYRSLKESRYEEMPFNMGYIWNRMIIFQDNYFVYHDEMMFIHNRYFSNSPVPKVPNDRALRMMFC